MTINFKLNIILVLIITLVLASCTPSKNDVKVWEKSKGGADKLVEIMSASSNKMEVRVEAILALSRMKEHLKITAALKKLDKSDLNKFISSSSDSFIKLMKSTNTKVVIRAKDNLLDLMQFANANQKDKIAKAVLTWAFDSPGEKFLEGRKNLELTILTCGKLSVPFIIEAISKGIMLEDLIRVTKKLNDKESLQKVADALIVFAQTELPFLKNETFEALTALKTDSCINLLNKIVVNKKVPAASRQVISGQLAQFQNPSTKEAALAIIKDKTDDTETRINMINYFTALKDKSVTKNLIALLKDPNVMWTAAAGSIKLLGKDKVRYILGKLPSIGIFNKEGFEYLIEVLSGFGDSIEPQMIVLLRSKKVMAKIIAINTLGKIGTKSSLKSLTKLVRDRFALKDWHGEGRDSTIGVEAAKSIEIINSK